MSRSYKKNPVYKYAPSSKRNGTKKAKREANKRIRRSECINGMFYKRLFQAWDIHDIIDRTTWKEFTKWYYIRKHDVYLSYLYKEDTGPNWNEWAKYFLRK